jgi:hypothetical protein
MLSVERYREGLMEKLIAFAYQKERESSRTTDVIKNIPIFIT